MVSLYHNHALLEDPWVILAVWPCEEPLPFEDLLREEPPCELPGKEAYAVAGCLCGQGITMTFEFLQYPQTLERVSQFESTTNEDDHHTFAYFLHTTRIVLSDTAGR